MKHMERELQTLVVRGKTQGYLTYDEVNDYLPDQDVTPEKLDNLLTALDEMGIELLDKAPPNPNRPQLKIFPPVAKDDDLPSLVLKPDDLEKKLNSDPIRMYLSQMAEIPLLTPDRRDFAGQEDRNHAQAISPHAAVVRLCHAGDGADR